MRLVERFLKVLKYLIHQPKNKLIRREVASIDRINDFIENFICFRLMASELNLRKKVKNFGFLVIQLDTNKIKICNLRNNAVKYFLAKNKVASLKIETNSY